MNGSRGVLTGQRARAYLLTWMLLFFFIRVQYVLFLFPVTWAEEMISGCYWPHF